MILTRRSLIASSAAGIATSALVAPMQTFARQATPAGATPATGGDSPEAAMLATMEELGIPGAIVLLDSPDTGLWTAALGVANLENGTPMTVDTHMRVGSITKTFTATLMLQLVDQGLLTLDDTLSDLLPELDTLPNAGNITMRHLLSMQSGLADYTASPQIEEVIYDLDREFTPQEIIALIDGEPALFDPGAEFMYSNTNYIILGMIAEKLTGSRYHELVQSSILDELGLAQTTIPTTPEISEPATRGYAYPMPAGTSATPIAAPVATPVADAASGPVDVTDINPWIPGAAGAMISTVGDLHTWMAAFMDGTLLSPEMHEAQFDVSNAPEVDGVRYGLGVVALQGAFGHTGGINGFESIMLHIPALDTTAIVLVNALPIQVPASATLALLQHILPI